MPQMLMSHSYLSAWRGHHHHHSSTVSIQFLIGDCIGGIGCQVAGKSTLVIPDCMMNMFYFTLNSPGIIMPGIVATFCGPEKENWELKVSNICRKVSPFFLLSLQIAWWICFTSPSTHPASSCPTSHCQCWIYGITMSRATVTSHWKPCRFMENHKPVFSCSHEVKI